jgi:predicted alpha/beta superfamily hydrolase
VPAGFFDASMEDEQDRRNVDFKPMLLQKIDEQADKRRDREEQEARKHDIKKQKLKQQFDAPNAILQVNKLNDPAQVMHKLLLLLLLLYCR